MTTPEPDARSAASGGPGLGTPEYLLQETLAVVARWRPDAVAHALSSDPTDALVALVADVLPDHGSPGPNLSRAAVRLVVRTLLDRLVERAPGRSVEVRVPPFAAVQCVEGVTHTRGTPPNVVETDPTTWIRLATGRLPWGEAIADGRVRASGLRADLSCLLPVTGGA